MASHQVDDFDTEDIIGLVQGKHYQLACTRYYEVTRAKMLDISTENLKGGVINSGQGNSGVVASQESIEHPNQFFEQSFLLTKSRGDGQSQSQPTVMGPYSYKKAGAQTSSNPSHDMEH